MICDMLAFAVLPATRIQFFSIYNGLLTSSISGKFKKKLKKLFSNAFPL